ncbi:hypothetical protein AWB78_06510 [Caballeronia calidae]|uniref:DUF7210 domain-containing protein n=1 Tax=Caballeronia calidae TaxID=1777139 RepID=A0A158E888_9BURK|nr:hypothetical protein [Caballeronia calidae]SAL03111.1 hypothetical protein AWB78_06510 [Caballeronia calidae]
MKVKVKRALSYANKRYAAGDVLDMSTRDAKLMAAVGRVSMAAEPTPTEEPDMPPPKSSKGKKRSGYKRRDIQAEDANAEAATAEPPQSE